MLSKEGKTPRAAYYVDGMVFPTQKALTEHIQEIVAASIEVVWMRPSGWHFVDQTIAQRWSGFHADSCKLRKLCKPCHVAQR